VNWRGGEAEKFHKEALDEGIQYSLESFSV